MTTVQDVIKIMDLIAPRWMGFPWDKNGLSAGSEKKQVNRLLVSLDASLKAIEFAHEKQCEMIVTHHPRFYKGFENLNEDIPLGKIGSLIARYNIAVFSAHTNLDSAPGGINDVLADVVEMTDRYIIDFAPPDPWRKVITFVPESSLEKVRQALFAAGAGYGFGEYDQVSFVTHGTGTFRASDKAKPASGKRGQFNEVPEARLEVFVPASLVPAAQQAVLSSHPYEVPVIDVVMLAQETRFGCGRVGAIPKPMRFSEIVKRYKKACRAKGVLVHGDNAKRCKRVAVWSGASVSVNDAIRHCPDVLVTGELRYSEAEHLINAGISLIVLGHGACEEIIIDPLAKRLQSELPDIKVLTCPDSVPQLRHA